MLDWKLIAGDYAAFGWGDSVENCLEAALDLIKRTSGDGSKLLPLSFHVMDPSKAKPPPSKPIRHRPSKERSIQGTWQYTAGAFFNMAKKPFYRRDLKAYLSRKGFTVTDNELANFLQERKREKAIYKHGRNRWARHP
jgi:hypothetical protein